MDLKCVTKSHSILDNSSDDEDSDFQLSKILANTQRSQPLPTHLESGNEQSHKRKKVIHSLEESENSDKTDSATKVKF